MAGMKNNLNAFWALPDLTQEQLAKKNGGTSQAVIAIENDKYSPSLGLAFKIASPFKIMIEDVFSYGEDDNEN